MSDRFTSAWARRRRRSFQNLPLVAFILDLVLLVIALVLATRFRDVITGTWFISGHAEKAAPIILLTWIVLLLLFRTYSMDNLGYGPDEYKQVVHAGLYTAGIAGIFCYLTQWDLSRGFFILVFVVGCVLLIVGRYTLRKIFHVLHARGYFKERVLLIGSPEAIDELATTFQRERWLGYEVVGAATRDPFSPGDLTEAGVPLLAESTTDEIVALSGGVDLIVFGAGAGLSTVERREIFWAIEESPVGVISALGISDVSPERVRSKTIGGIPLLYVQKPTWTAAHGSGKRIFDIVIGSLLVAVCLPFFAIIALVIKLTDRGPVFFRQERVGRYGKTFECFKFRSMVVDAEARLQQHFAEQGLVGENTPLNFKLQDDPRVTRVGKWLRRFSVDEFPQLFNVVRGEMSLVGPRPPLVREFEIYDDAMLRRLNLRPGMTGLWQVSGRSDLSPEEAMRLDLYYIDNWSMLSDFAILMRTLQVVVTGRGAY